MDLHRVAPAVHGQPPDARLDERGQLVPAPAALDHAAVFEDPLLRARGDEVEREVRGSAAGDLEVGESGVDERVLRERSEAHAEGRAEQAVGALGREAAPGERRRVRLDQPAALPPLAQPGGDAAGGHRPRHAEARREARDQRRTRGSPLDRAPEEGGGRVQGVDLLAGVRVEHSLRAQPLDPDAGGRLERRSG
jgi:hypothetical protein